MSELTPSRDNGRSRPIGYAPWSPRREARAIVNAANDVLEVYDDQVPLTIRQVYYQLVVRGVIDKTQREYSRLCEIMNRARRARMVPFELIRDDGAVVLKDRHYAGIDDFMDDHGRRVRRYRRDRQVGQSQRIELWCEAAGMMEQLSRVADEYSVPVYSCGGFVSITSIKDLANRARNYTVPLVVLHVGDLDPSGVSIYDRLIRDAQAFTEADRIVETSRIIGQRVAVTPDQVAKYELPTAPPKSSDSRTTRWEHGETCEADALPPNILAQLVTDAIEEWVDLDRFDAEVQAEQSDRAALLQLGSGS